MENTTDGVVNLVVEKMGINEVSVTVDVMISSVLAEG